MRKESSKGVLSWLRVRISFRYCGAVMKGSDHFSGINYMKNIILIGMPASGKSTVGVILAKVLGKGFIDTLNVRKNKEGGVENGVYL